MIEAIRGPGTKGAESPSGEISLARDVLLLLVTDGTARILDFGGGFYALSAVGAAMLVETLDRGTASATEAIAARYGADARQVREDVDRLLDELRRRGLIGPGGRARRWSRRSQRLAE